MSFFSRIIRYLTFVAALAGFVGIAFVLRTINAQEKRDIPPPPIEPAGKPYEHTVAATGILEALSENVSLGVPIAGLVTDVSVKVNDSVKEGAALFRLDDRDLQAQLLKQRAAIEVAKAQIDVSKANVTKMEDMFKRVRDMPDNRAVSADEVNQRQNDLNVAKAQLAASNAQLLAAQADVQQTEVMIERLTVRAPREGTIIQVNIRAGEYAGTAPKIPAMVLGDLDKLQVRADVDEQNATRIRIGQEAKAYLKGDTTTAIPLKFIRIEPYVIPKVSLTGASTERVDTRVLQVIYSMDKPQNSSPMYVGQQVDIFINAADSAAKAQPRP
jgi:RND family efflux transporter MFP subunit